MTPEDIYDLKEEFLNQNPYFRDWPFDEVLESFCDLLAKQIEADQLDELYKTSE